MMFNSCIITDVLVTFGHSILDSRSVTVYPCAPLEKPMSVVPLILSAMRWDNFFDDSSSITFRLKDV